jgi:hypothetical protein
VHQDCIPDRRLDQRLAPSQQGPDDGLHNGSDRELEPDRDDQPHGDRVDLERELVGHRLLEPT